MLRRHGRDVTRILSLGAEAHGERGVRAYNWGLGAEPPAGSRGRAPGGEREREKFIDHKQITM